MKRKIISVFLVLILCLSMAVGASANADTDYVIDEMGNLASGEIDESS